MFFFRDHLTFVVNSQIPTTTKLDSVSQVVVLYNNCLTKIIIGSIIYVCAKICWKTWKLPPFVAHKYGEMIF